MVTNMTRADWLQAARVFERKAGEARRAGYMETAARLSAQAAECLRKADGR